MLMAINNMKYGKLAEVSREKHMKNISLVQYIYPDPSMNFL